MLEKKTDLQQGLGPKGGTCWVFRSDHPPAVSHIAALPKTLPELVPAKEKWQFKMEKKTYQEKRNHQTTLSYVL